MSSARDSVRALVRAYLRRRYTILFYTLVFTLLSAPVLSALKFSGTLLESLLAASPPLCNVYMPADHCPVVDDPNFPPVITYPELK